MNHHHRKVLHALFAHPISANIDPRPVEALIGELGGEVSHGGHGQLLLRLNGHTHALRDARHSLSKDDVSAVRHFLAEAGVDPLRDYPL
jgi:hypothetical protein